MSLRLNVQHRAATRRPAAAGEVVFQAVDRQVITPFAGDNFGRDAGVVLVAFNDSGRTPGRSDAALRVVPASVLRVDGHADFEFRSFELQRFGALPHRIGEQCFPAVIRAGLFRFRQFGGDFVTRQVCGKALVTFLFRLATPVSGDMIGFFKGIAQSRCRVGRVVGIAKVQTKLIGVGNVAFAASQKSLSPQFVVGRFPPG